jgi:O-antigen biosynthesis protein WbqV
MSDRGAAPTTDRDAAAPTIDWDAVTGRPPFAVDGAAVAHRVGGRTVLVTGAAGSLGVPLTLALAGAGARRLVLYDHHESSLFRLREALTSPGASGAEVRAVLGDVRDARRIRRLLGAERPDLVFHLAAYKHVPWGEEDPEAFAAANVLGAQHVLEGAREAGVGQIVYPSTDKAIDPPSLYGATKRLVEGMLRVSAAGGGPRAVIVRFVNVLGSQGSAPETFARLTREGRPLTITDPRMRRYWITPQHARLLLLHGACLDPLALGAQGSLTVAPDAGDEISLMDVARRVWACVATPAQQASLAGPGVGARPDGAPSGQPPGQPPVRVTGSRPGERLAEPLTAPYEQLEALPLPGLLAVRGGPPADPQQVAEAVQRVRRLLDEGAGPEALRAALFRPC